MKKRKDYQFWVPISVIGAVVIAAAIGVVIAVQPFDKVTSKCDDPGMTHRMSVGKDAVTPADVQGVQCDILTITNDTGGDRTIMFGHVEHMVAYDGVTEKQLKNGESFSIRLYEKGEFHFHEHETDLVGTFAVR